MTRDSQTISVVVTFYLGGGIEVSQPIARLSDESRRRLPLELVAQELAIAFDEVTSAANGGYFETRQLESGLRVAIVADVAEGVRRVRAGEAP